MQFVFGMVLALVMQEKRMRGQKVYRILLVLPHALPIFMTALVWKGMFNTDFGIINQILGAHIAWFNNGWLAKITLLVVNLWIGYAYMFLVVTGALTAIPNDLEGSRLRRRRQRYAGVPNGGAAAAHGQRLAAADRILFVQLQQLHPGPVAHRRWTFPGAQIEGGQTDLLITYTYRLAFGSADQLLGFASAISMLIFIIVAGISAYGFRLTRRLEEIKA